MYLFVYIFLLLAIMGLYSQLFLLRVARLNENQKSVAEIMMVWHGGAYQMAKEEEADITPGVGGCFVSPFSAAPCDRVLQNPNNPVVAPYARHYLPAGYQYDDVRFPSIVYEVGGARYLVTYVSVDTLGYTPQQILAQMRHTDFPKISYGGAALVSCNGTNAHWLVTNEFAPGTRQICYPTSSAGAGGTIYVPDEAVGLVSKLSG